MSSRVIEAKKSKISDMAEKVASALGFEIYEFSVRFKKGSTVVYVKIDNGQNVSHEDCANYSRSFISALEEEEVVTDFSVEVSSPGLKRKIRNENEFKRFEGSPVKIIYFDESGEKSFASKGVLKEAMEKSVIVKEDGREVEINYSAVKSANLDY